MSFLVTFFLITARVSGLVMSMPLLNSKLVPNLVKTILVLLISAVLAPVIPQESRDIGIGLLLLSITSEMMLGIL